MKIKAKANFYFHEKARLIDVNEEIDVKDEVGQDLIAAGYAENIVIEPKVKVRKKVGDE